MTTAASSAIPAPAWITQQTQQLLAQQGHAWLLYGPSGLGQYGLALALARAWLCEQPQAHGACGQCGSCHAIEVRTHADLCVLMPETQLLDRQWPLGEKAQADIDDKKRKPSREIRVEAMRDAIEFAQRTSARGRGKVVLVYPAEQMNTITANALLKTLEEPPGDVKFVLATESAHQLLPTIRSRCLGHAMYWPNSQEAQAWLHSQGLAPAQADALLMAAGGRPEDALDLAAQPQAAADWTAFPQAMARGDVGFVRDWAMPYLVDSLHKLSHDVLVLHHGASPRFFPAPALPQRTSAQAVSDWGRALARSRKTMEHPFNAGLMQEALVAQAKAALQPAAA